MHSVHVQTVKLVDLLDEARDRCAASIAERRGDGAAAGDADIAAAAAAMGYGAVKYADLKNSRLTNYQFSMDGMLSMKGNTAVYLLYAHARIAGIVRKSERDVDALKSSAKIELGAPEEVRPPLSILWGASAAGLAPAQLMMLHRRLPRPLPWCARHYLHRRWARQPPQCAQPCGSAVACVLCRRRSRCTSPSFQRPSRTL